MLIAFVIEMLVIGFVGVENEGIFGLIGGVMEFFAGAF
jgi:hypothetical protein